MPTTKRTKRKVKAWLVISPNHKDREDGGFGDHKDLLFSRIGAEVRRAELIAESPMRYIGIGKLPQVVECTITYTYTPD